MGCLRQASRRPGKLRSASPRMPSLCTWSPGQPASCGPEAPRERVCPARPPHPPCGPSSRPSCSREVSLTRGTPSSGQKPPCSCQGMCQPRSSTPCFGDLQRLNPRKTACPWPPAVQPTLAGAGLAPGEPDTPAGRRRWAGPANLA